MSESIEINIEARRFSISLAPLSARAQSEIRAFFSPDNEQKRVKIVELLQAYITKSEEHARLHQSLEHLYSEIEQTQKASKAEASNIDSPQIDILSSENL